MNGRILPITYPSVTSWTWQADLFAMIEQHPNAKEWIYSNYIQIYCRPEIGSDYKLFLDFFPSYTSFFECPVLHTQYIDRKFVYDSWKSIKDFLIYCIDHDYYIYAVCNEKKIIESKIDYLHELFVYGYDLDEKVFWISDFSFSKSGKYETRKASFESVCEGFNSVGVNQDYLLRWEGGFVLCKLSQKIENRYHLDTKFIKRNLKEYLDGYNSHIHFSSVYNLDSMEMNAHGEKVEYCVFGIDTYEILCNYLCSRNNCYEIDVRPFHNLYEHKKLMKDRIKYLIGVGKIENNFRMVNMIEEIEEQCLIAMHLVLKGKIGNNMNDVKRTFLKLNHVKESEEEVLLWLHNQL